MTEARFSHGTRVAVSFPATVVVDPDEPNTLLIQDDNGVRRPAGHETLTPLLSGLDWSGRITTRRLQMLVLVARGWSNDAIGDELGIGAETVKTHLRYLYRTLGAEKRVDLVVKAFRLGLLAVDPATGGIKAHRPARQGLAPLSEKERALLPFLQGPLSYQAIGQRLHYSKSAVTFTARAIAQKWGVHSREEIVETALLHDLLEASRA